MSNKKLRLPASYGGIIQYYDEYTSKIVISPWTVIFLGILLIAIVFALHSIG